MHIYKQLGYIYKSQTKYLKALKCFKKVLYISWFLDDQSNELSAYEGIALNYFYLGNPQKALHYAERANRGK